jgi:hypothetical protein
MFQFGIEERTFSVPVRALPWKTPARRCEVCNPATGSGCSVCRGSESSNLNKQKNYSFQRLLSRGATPLNSNYWTVANPCNTSQCLIKSNKSLDKIMNFHIKFTPADLLRSSKTSSVLKFGDCPRLRCWGIANRQPLLNQSTETRN